jgi:hypothetical protein
MIGLLYSDLRLCEGCLLALHRADGTTSDADGFNV